MPITGTIPLPENGYESLMRSATGTQNILSSILQGRQNQQTLGQNQQKIAQDQQRIALQAKRDAQQAIRDKQLNQYQMGELAIRHQSEARAQTLLPYLIQGYKDVHDKNLTEHEMKKLEYAVTKAQYDAAMKGYHEQLGLPPPPSTQSLGGKDNAPPQMPEEQAPASSAQSMVIPAEEEAPAQLNQPNLGQQQPKSLAEMVKGSIYQPGLNIQNSPAFSPSPEEAATGKAGVPPAPPAPQAPNMPPEAPNMGAPGANQPQEATPQPGAQPQAGQEILLKRGKPGLELQDALSGTKFMQDWPKIHYGANGLVYSQWPSGKLTVVKPPAEAGVGTAETPEEKRAGQIKVANAKKEFELNQKEAINVKKQAEPLIKVLNTAVRMRNILKRNQNLTGFGTPTAKKYALANNKDLAAFDTDSGILQAEIGKYASTRGGIQAVQWAGTVKPSISNSQQYNEGMLDEIIANAKRDLDDRKSEYKDYTQKDLPLKYKEPEEDMVNVRDNHTGKVTKMKRSEAEKLVGGQGG